MASRSPRLSIGMPVYNAGPMVRTAIESLLAQDYTDFELIICDNASTDDTYQTCLEYAAKDTRVRVDRNEVNLGAAPNYNRTLQLASGEYFKWQCHDDWCAPTFLSRCIEVLDKDPSVVLAYPQTTVVDDDGSYLYQYQEPADGSSHRVVQRFSRFYWNLALCNVLFGVMRTDALKSTREWHPSIWEGDKVLLMELALRGRLVEVPEPLFFRRYSGPRQRDATFLNATNRKRAFMRRGSQYVQQLRATLHAPINPLQKAAVASHIALRFLVGQKTRRSIAYVSRFHRALVSAK